MPNSHSRERCRNRSPPATGKDKNTNAVGIEPAPGASWYRDGGRAAGPRGPTACKHAGAYAAAALAHIGWGGDGNQDGGSGNWGGVPARNRTEYGVQNLGGGVFGKWCKIESNKIE